MRASRSERPSASSPPRARRQRRRRSSGRGMIVNTQYELEQRQCLGECLLVDRCRDRAWLYGTASDLIEQPTTPDCTERRERATQHRQELEEILLRRRNHPF